MDKKARVFIASFVLVLLLAAIMVVAKSSGTDPRGAKECNDGIDNDGDGATDWPADAGCKNKNDNDETNCGDGVCEGGETTGSCPADCPANSCGDTDGGNAPLVYGTTSGYYNYLPYSSNDYCVDSSNINEYYCSGVLEQSQQLSCGTDGYVGGNYCMSGSVYKDYNDYYCGAGACSYATTPTLQESCQYGCTAGVCDLLVDSCFDTDAYAVGFEAFVPGNVSGYYSGYPYHYADFCIDSTTVLELSCVGTQYASSNISCSLLNATGCSTGACY